MFLLHLLLCLVLPNLFAQIAQSVEQRTENPRVTGSIPVLGTYQKTLIWGISSVGRALDF